MTYRDPYMVPDGPVARLAARICKYDGSLPSATFTPREKWKTGQTSSSSTPQTHQFVHEGDMVVITSGTDFVNKSKRSGGEMDLAIGLDNFFIEEKVGYPHMQPGGKRDQRHLAIAYTRPIAETLAESLVGRPLRDLVDMPKWLDSIFGWRRLLRVECCDPLVMIIDHRQWNDDLEPQ
jgi:hypothetical protein